ncbi:hypothetical protein LXL04_003473 [Taraxacum kok-saghyz]
MMKFFLEPAVGSTEDHAPIISESVPSSRHPEGSREPIGVPGRNFTTRGLRAKGLPRASITYSAPPHPHGLLKPGASRCPEGSNTGPPRGRPAILPAEPTITCKINDEIKNSFYIMVVSNTATNRLLTPTVYVEDVHHAINKWEGGFVIVTEDVAIWSLQFILVEIYVGNTYITFAFDSRLHQPTSASSGFAYLEQPFVRNFSPGLANVGCPLSNLNGFCYWHLAIFLSRQKMAAKHQHPCDEGDGGMRIDDDTKLLGRKGNESSWGRIFKGFSFYRSMVMTKSRRIGSRNLDDGH